MKIGTRLGAIQGWDYKKVSVYGFGIYKGETTPCKNAIGYGKYIISSGITCPEIYLDDGKTIWGCECWVFDEKDVKKMIEEYDDVVYINIENMRV